MKLKIFVLLFALTGCAQYASPPHNSWNSYLNGASFMDMTETSKIAKRPVYLGRGGKLLNANIDKSATLDYGDKTTNDNMASREYMAKLEYDLYDSLRTAGVSVERAGTDVVVILVRDAIIAQNHGDISDNGADILKTIAQVLQKYNSTYLEIAGYTDSMRDATAARRMSLDMAERVGVYLTQQKINPARMFIVGRGAARPIASQDGVGRLTNRRVEIRLAPTR